MKNTTELLPALLLAVLAVSCETLDSGLFHTDPRWSVSPSAGGNAEDNETSTDPSLYISAVRAPDDYDWRRDSAWDKAEYELIVLKDGKEILSIPTGSKALVSADPDLHHLIGGDLYTEYCDRTSTYIGSNGKSLLKWTGREILVGLQKRSDGLWTLGRNRSGDGFSLRKDGAVVMKKESGSVLGGFHANGYGENGALLEDGGDLCFCYVTKAGGLEALFSVIDGVETLVKSSSAETTLDAKVIDGDICVLYNVGENTLLSYRGNTMDYGEPGFMVWTEAGIVRYKGEICASGLYSVMSGMNLCGIGWDASYEPLDMSEGEVFVDEQHADCYCPWMSDGILLSRSCGTFMDGKMIIALNPADTTSRPRLWTHEGVIEEFDLNGFLTGVEVVSPAT